MLRFIIDQFRQAPGPLKHPRILIADLAEEIVDLVGQLIKSPKDESAAEKAYPCCGESAPRPPVPASAPAPAQPAAAHSGDDDDDDYPAHAVSAEIDPRLAKALALDANMRKQAFKVLAILWDADQKKLGSLSAKAIARHGETLNLIIRHENVRKVIRMRLENYVKMHAQGVGNGTVYRYELSSKGRDHFVSTYLE